MAKISKFWKKIRFSDYSSNNEMAFDREMMRSERTRALIMVGASLGIALWCLAAERVFPGYFRTIGTGTYHGHTAFTWLAIIFAVLTVYELFYALLVIISLCRKALFPYFHRLINALIEISIPTVIFYFAFQIYRSPLVFFSPVILFYTLFIISSSLRSLSLFTGLTAGIEFIGLSLYLLGGSGTGSSVGLGLHAAAGMLMMLSGLLVDIVSIQIRKRIRHMLRTTDEKNHVMNMFGQHVSPEVVEKLMALSDGLHAEKNRVCVMFLDIRNFTEFSETREPEDVVNYLNTLFAFMIDIINRNGGIINKFLGDGFMAVFGAPFETDEICLKAVKASKEILAHLDMETASGAIQATGLGIGIHTGHAVTGHVGSTMRKEYTLIGDVVNLASRIEQMNKTYGSRLLVSEEVWQEIKELGFSADELGAVAVRGRTGLLRLYRLE